MTGLYIHIPICVSVCRYCDFYKLTPREWNQMDLFIDSLRREFERLPSGFAPDTLFIGGGTPTALSARQFSQLLQVVRDTIDCSRVVEFTSEANPGTLTEKKVEAMIEGGINRFSMGVQSFDTEALSLLGRIHSAEDVEKGFEMIRSAGIDNINLDLIQSIPGMTREAILNDIRRAIALQPEHLSCYNLIYEPGTPMTRDRDAGLLHPPGDEEEADTYHAVKDELEQAGYAHYEISNFCRPEDRECLHNLLYWQGDSYFGCGPSASSHWNDKRYTNIRDLQGYCDRLQMDQAPFDEKELLTPEEKARETLVMGLRLIRGVDLAAFEASTGFSVDHLCGADVRHMEEEGLLQRGGGRLALSREALFVSNAVFSELV